MLGMRPRRPRLRSSRTLHPAVIVALCLVGAIIVTVVAGNLLRLWLDDETYQKYTEGEQPAPTPDGDYQAKVRKINAYPFVLGNEIDAVIGSPALSVTLNQENGSLSYSSDVAAYLGLPQNTDVELSDALGELSAYVNYVSGVFYPQALSQPTTDLLYAAALQEAALLREFVQIGGNELVLRGLPLSADRLNALTLYLKAVKSLLPQVPVGVSVPLSVAASEDGWEIIATLLQVCDFCALDLGEEEISEEPATDGEISAAAEDLLAQISYYLTQYDMRVLITEDQTALLFALEIQMHPNYQVISARN